MPKITYAKLLSLLEVSLFVTSAVLAIIFPPVGLVLCGISLASLSLKKHDQQKTVLMGDNPNEAIAVGYTQVMMCSLIFITLLILSANPVFAPVLSFIPIAWTCCIAITMIAAMRAGGYKTIRDSWLKSEIRPLVFIINVVDFSLDPINNILGLVHNSLISIKNKLLSKSNELFNKWRLIPNSKYIQKNVLKASIKFLMFIKPAVEYCANNFPKNISDVAGLFLNPINKILGSIHGGLIFIKNKSLSALKNFSDKWSATANSNYIQRYILKINMESLNIIISVIGYCADHFPRNTSDIARFAKELTEKIAAPVKTSLINLTNKFLRMVDNGLAAVAQSLKSINLNLSEEKRLHVRLLLKARNIIVSIIINKLDNLLKAMPKTAENISQSASSFTLQNWLGTFYLIAQVALFAVVCGTGAPILGIAGLSYVAVSTIDKEKLLPKVASIVIEKVNSWVEFTAGIFIPDPLMTVYTLYNVSAYVFIKLFLPTASKLILGKNANILTLGKKDQPDEIKPIIKKDINVYDFEALLQIMAAPKLENKNPQNGMPKDIENLIKNIDEFKQQQGVIKTRKELYDAFLSLKTSPYVTDKIKYYASYVPMKVYWYSVSAIYNPIILKEFLKQKTETNPYGITMEHIWDAPILLPEKTPVVDFAAFKELVDSLNLESQEELNRIECLNSAAFKNKYPLFVREDEESQKKFSTKYVKEQMSSICEKINTGKGLTQDKTIEGQEYIRKIGNHVIQHCHDLLVKSKPTDDITAVCSIFRELTIGVAERCPKALEIGLFDLYKACVWEKLIEQQNISPKQKLAINMQTLRLTKFNQLYNTLSSSNSVRAGFFFIDFDGTHDKGAIEDSMVSLNLKNANNDIQTDISSQSNDVLKEIAVNVMSYGIANLLMICENGYSIEAIINYVIYEIGHSEQSNTTRALQIYELFTEWKKQFPKESGVREVIDNIMTDAYDTDSPEIEQYLILRNKVIILFLIDMGVFKFNDLAKKQEIEVFFNPDKVNIRKNTRELAIITDKLANLEKELIKTKEQQQQQSLLFAARPVLQEHRPAAADRRFPRCVIS